MIPPSASTGVYVCRCCGVQLTGMRSADALAHVDRCDRLERESVRDGRQVMNVLQARGPAVLRRFEDGMRSTI